MKYVESILDTNQLVGLSPAFEYLYFAFNLATKESWVFLDRSSLLTFI